MTKPYSLSKYPDVDLKLGIKSSLPNVKATLALALMFWRASNTPSQLAYSKAAGDSIEIADDIASQMMTKYRQYYGIYGISDERFLDIVNENQLFKSQLESLIVAFELVWRLAKVQFVGNMASSFERTGGKRYPKVLHFTKNMDILDTLLSSDDAQYSKVLLSWIGLNVEAQNEFNNTLLHLLNYLSEDAVYKLADDERDIVFNMNSVYTKLIDGQEGVDINDSKEAKGSLRILKSALTDNMYPFLSFSNTHGITVADGEEEKLEAYSKRVDTYLSLTNAKHIIAVSSEDDDDTKLTVESEAKESLRCKGGKNVILYGVPGSGKSHTIKEQYCDDESRMERIVFHPDYTYSDFAGQILPNVMEGNVSYDFVPGPFTRLLQKSQEEYENEYFLVIEEINRGNAPAIFGEVFQLLDRDSDGTSEYSISNADIARIVYGDEKRKIRIPSNMSIIGTMNTSDQNVFTLDTAFQRRWSMRMIENDLSRVPYADEPILDTSVSWRRFNSVLNNEILKKSVRITSSEDKRLGAFFIREDDLRYDFRENDDMLSEEERRNAAQHNSMFPEKVLKYLWDDACKFYREDVFYASQNISLEDVIGKFRAESGDERLSVFKEEIQEALLQNDEEDEEQE
jgi:MoxR-like ATPase